MLRDTAETFREGVAERGIWQCAPSSPQPTPRCFGPCCTSRALKGNTKRTMALQCGQGVPGSWAQQQEADLSQSMALQGQ